MKKLLTLSALVIFTLIACKKEEKIVKGNFTNPNGETELALFMKQIHDETVLAKKACSEGKKYDFQAKEQTLFTKDAANPKKVASEQYQILGQAYLNALKKSKVH